MNEKNVLPQTVQAKLAEQDAFEVPWARRDKYGNLTLATNMFKVRVAPPPFFGQNLKEWDLNTAEAMAEEESWDPGHDFGTCTLRDGSLRKIGEGSNARWVIDLLVVDRDKARYVLVANQFRDEEGKIVVDDNGEALVRFSDRKETWITVDLDMVEPVTTHVFSAPYLQRDRGLQALLRMNAKSQKIAAAKGGGRTKNAGKRERLTSAQMQAKLAALRAKEQG